MSTKSQNAKMYISIRNLRCFGGNPVILDIRPITCLIGPHGSGKSSVVMALKLLDRDNNEFRFEDLNSSGMDVELEYLMINEGKETKSHISFLKSPFSGVFNRRMIDYSKPKNDALPKVHVYSDELMMFSNSFMDNLSSIGREFSRAYDKFERFILLETKNCRPTLMIAEKGGAQLPILSLSRGVRKYLFILAFLCDEQRDGILIIENPDCELHPDLIHHLAGVIKQASKRCKIVFTTHSSDLVSEFSDCPESVVVCERPFDVTELTRTDPEPLKQWLEEYTLGHAWQSGAIGGRM